MAANENEAESEISKERFGFTIFLSACMHAIIILGIGFTYLEKINSEPALEITMAQYRSEFAPEDTDFLAQENQIGSGVLDESAAPSTPFLSDFHADTIQEVQPVPRRMEQVNPVQLQDMTVIATTQQSNRVNELLEEAVDEQVPVAEIESPQELSLAIASLRAQLDLRRQEFSKRPRRYTISSASTKKSQDALYLDNWRRRIEAVGNLNYPDAARRQQLYGSMRLLVSILPDGSVADVQVLQSSGHVLLDNAALEIVNLAAPFEPFPAAMRAEADILKIIRTWRFHEGNALTSY